jgi:hypothetical protein
MKIRLVYMFLASLVFLCGCKKEEEITNQIIDGHYKGTFQREWVWADSETANVTFTFSSNKWSGSSESYKYPALSHGTYSIIGDTIIFNSGGAWSTEFDWSLILSGKYVLSVDGARVEFTKDYRSATSDTYIDRYVLYRED